MFEHVGDDPLAVLVLIEPTEYHGRSEAASFDEHLFPDGGLLELVAEPGLRFLFVAVGEVAVADEELKAAKLACTEAEALVERASHELIEDSANWGAISSALGRKPGTVSISTLGLGTRRTPVWRSSFSTEVSPGVVAEVFMDM